MYYPCSENKGADQLCSYCTADLRLCFEHMQIVGFLIIGKFMPNFLFQGCFLQKLKQGSETSETSSSSASDSNTFYEDDFSSSDESSDDGQLLS